MTPTKTSLVTTDDTEDEVIQQPKIYAKNSFDRFGDDLCGHILSYLSLDDRFDYECVSKQFQRTVFESVVDIALHDKFVRSRTDVNDMKMLATISRKCSHIHTIDIRRIDTKKLPEVLTIFRNNCRHLRNIYCILDTNTAQMMPEFGPMVTQIDGIWLDERQVLNDCHHLSRLRSSLSNCFDNTSGKLLVKNLQRIEFSYNISNNNQQLSAFVAQNQSLRSVEFIDSGYQTHESLTEMAEQLSRLPQLRHLELDLKPTNGQNSLDESLRTIGQKCRQLKRLTLRLSYNNNCGLEDQSLDSLRSYPRLKRLDLIIRVIIDDVFLDPMKHCHRLTHLSLNSSQMSDNLFVNCDKHWPRLQYLFIKTNDMTVECLDHISRLPALQTLAFECKQFIGSAITRNLLTNNFMDNVCEDLLTKSLKLKTIEIRRNTVSKIYCRKNGINI
ncbi:unnamed protein product [Medioppia subpectinata]|uniref:F-box domain-containing protein n=1 Tax=Medioppia subpectinata TaxID=1979941 RepID=A0A7R9PV70_9ACAR|nr:unnamed protein product [Medioppia subpectinata]CAG2102289.1 unnamed protein product [Medioppia subpectinata]